jgi:GrpB-like predicted nucleotidyltransferase (UPF0157 family)
VLSIEHVVFSIEHVVFSIEHVVFSIEHVVSCLEHHVFFVARASMDEVEIVEYDPAWPAMFVAEATRLDAVLEEAMAVEHFGSTAVPGLAAKPIIDVLVVVRSLVVAQSWVEGLRGLDYVFWEENPKTDRLFFVRGMPPFGARRTHHLHVTEPGGEMVERLLFRDYLRAHPDEADRYAALKRTLAARHRTDREAYTRAKADYIAAIMPIARASISRDG